MSAGMPHTPSGGGSIAPPKSPLPSVNVSTKALRSMVKATARRNSGLSTILSTILAATTRSREGTVELNELEELEHQGLSRGAAGRGAASS